MTGDWPFDISEHRWLLLWSEISAFDDQSNAWHSPEEAKAIVFAILYRALADIEWQDLPQIGPPSEVVRATYCRWQETKLLDRLSDVLRVQLVRDSPTQ